MFQSQYSMETIMIMIKNGTYPLIFQHFLEIKAKVAKKVLLGVKGEEQFSCTQLFQKNKHQVMLVNSICLSSPKNMQLPIFLWFVAI